MATSVSQSTVSTSARHYAEGIDMSAAIQDATKRPDKEEFVPNTENPRYVHYQIPRSLTENTNRPCEQMDAFVGIPIDGDNVRPWLPTKVFPTDSIRKWDLARFASSSCCRALFFAERSCASRCTFGEHVILDNATE